MSDIEKSFTFLHESIAQWLVSVAEVEAKVVSMQEELARVPVSRSLPLKRKTGSVESIRDLNAIMEEPNSPAPAQSSPLMTRKRKTPSVLSGNASGPSKFRSRMMIVVSYDGEIQKSFELMVRAIGTGRNLLRKGKMAAKLEAMAALAGDDDDDDDNDDAIMSKIGYRHRTGLTSMRTRATMMQGGTTNNNSSSTPTELFDSTDKELEAAQSLCEKAAHQSLREGDCRKELEAVRKHFQVVQGIADLEVAKYTARKEKEEREQAAAPPPEPKTEIPTITPTPVASTPITSEPKLISPIQSPPPNGVPQVIDIEVDDEEEEDVEFVMPPIRFTSRV